jgi:hypothetical protein
MNENLLQNNLFAFYLSYNPEWSSEVTFGYYDESRFEAGTLNWHPVVNNMFFAIELVDVRYGDTSLNICGPDSPLGKSCTATPDSGTSMMSMPTWALDQLAQTHGEYF